MDGYALGKTKVFLKYYHIEFMAKQYERQIRKIIRVQAVVRRWLAHLRFKSISIELYQNLLIIGSFGFIVLVFSFRTFIGKTVSFLSIVCIIFNNLTTKNNFKMLLLNSYYNFL
jgi:hypothetical protein